MRKLFYIILLVIGATTISCVHDYPEDEGVDPTLVNLATSIELDLEFLPLEINTLYGTRASADMQLRFVVEIWREGQTLQREVVLYDLEEGQTSIKLPLELKLNAVEYELFVWADYVERGSEADYFYDTSNLRNLVCTEPYRGSTDYRDCLYGKNTLDLRPYRDEWNANVDVKIDMERPLAKYQIIATDVEEFLDKTKSEGGEYTARFSYGFYFLTGFDLVSDSPVNSILGVTFTAPIRIERNETGEALLGWDYIFVNGVESFTILNIEILDSSGKVISRTNGIEIPYKREHLTTLRADILTNEMSGGVEFDPEWGEDVDVDLDELF